MNTKERRDKKKKERRRKKKKKMKDFIMRKGTRLDESSVLCLYSLLSHQTVFFPSLGIFNELHHA